MTYEDNSLQYAPVHRNKDIVDLLGVDVFPLEVMGRDDMWCRYPSELEYLLETHYMWATTEAYVGSDLVLCICN